MSKIPWFHALHSLPTLERACRLLQRQVHGQPIRSKRQLSLDHPWPHSQKLSKFLSHSFTLANDGTASCERHKLSSYKHPKFYTLSQRQTFSWFWKCSIEDINLRINKAKMADGMAPSSIISVLLVDSPCAIRSP